MIALLLAASVTLTPTPAPAATPSPQPQPRPLERLEVPPEALTVDDGDTVVIRWSPTDAETVRILGIDAPETRHVEHDLPFAQPLGPEARAFGRGAFAAARRIELHRARTLDPFGRTLGYLFIEGRNYSTLIVRAGLADESVTRFGDNGFPKEAAEVAAAAQAARPFAFEPPYAYRARMRELSRALRERGAYPAD